MKFYLLPVGEKFEYQGEIYIKADKLIANSEQTGKNRLIPRSANVKPVNVQADSSPGVIEDHQVQTAKVLTEFDRYHQRCLQCLSEFMPLTDAKFITAKKDELEAARQHFIDSLLD
ncbi:MAG: hypothetical protein P8Y24_13340 [Gammaproteobacteria bacterium]